MTLLFSGCLGKSRNFKFSLTVRPGFKGDILVSEDRNFKWNPDTIYPLDATDGAIEIPTEALKGASSVVEVKDSTGKILSKQLQYNAGDVGVAATVMKDGKRYFRIGELVAE
ncbi:MAG: hypothetical protein WCG75_03765 [Armatimonadota bacterium]